MYSLPELNESLHYFFSNFFQCTTNSKSNFSINADRKELSFVMFVFNSGKLLFNSPSLRYVVCTVASTTYITAAAKLPFANTYTNKAWVMRPLQDRDMGKAIASKQSKLPPTKNFPLQNEGR